MLKLWFAGLGLALCWGAQAADYTDSKGRIWRDLTTLNLNSPDQLAAICSPQCTGSIGSVDLTGWTWANRDEAIELFLEFTPVAPAFGFNQFADAQRFLALFSETYQWGGERGAVAWTSTYYADGDYYDELRVTVSPSFGLFLVEPVNPDPRFNKGALLYRVAPPPARDCVLNGQTISHGLSVVAYQAASVPFGQACVSETRVCSNGVLSGSYPLLSCNVQPAAACQFNGQSVAHGASVVAYAASSVAFGGTCSSQVRTCSNGVLSGSFSAASCSVQAAQSCQFNGRVISHGASVTAFLAASVPAGSTCQSEARQCNNGQLSGSYAAASCSVQSSEPPPQQGQVCQRCRVRDGVRRCEIRPVSDCRKKQDDDADARDWRFSFR